jgi:hypothetical protein
MWRRKKHTPRKVIESSLRRLARQAGFELGGFSKRLHVAQPADHWVPTGDVQVHDIQSVHAEHTEEERIHSEGFKLEEQERRRSSAVD